MSNSPEAVRRARRDWPRKVKPAMLRLLAHLSRTADRPRALTGQAKDDWDVVFDHLYDLDRDAELEAEVLRHLRRRQRR